MSSTEVFNFIDLTLRSAIFVLALLTTSLIFKIDADVIRSRIYVSFRKIKGAFMLLTIGFMFYLAEVFVDITFPTASYYENEIIMGILRFFFQMMILFFMFRLYVAIRVPDKRVL